MPITQPPKVTNRDSGALFDDQSNSTASKNINANNVVNDSTTISTSDLRTITETEIKTLKHITYVENTDKLVADRAIETTLNSLFLGEQHKMSSGSENIFFTNLTTDINFFPMWGGLKDQSVTANQGASGFIPPSGRIFSDMFSLPLRGNPDPLTSVGYAGDNYFGVNISGLGITTTAAEEVDESIRLEYRIRISGKNVYKQVLPRNNFRSNVAGHIYAGDVIEWFFDHPVDVRAGTTLFAEIHKVRISDDVDLGVFQVRQGDTPNADGTYQYQATVHNRLFEDKDLELISPYLKYKAMDFGLDSTGSTILLRDLSIGADSLLAPHAVNTLEAVAVGTEIKIKLKDGAKIIVESLPVNAITVNGAYVNSVLNQAVIELNNVFTNTVGFVSPDTFVSSFALTGNDLTLGLNDGVSYTVDVTSLGVDENNFVASGALSGTDLLLTMDDATVVTVDATSLAVDTNTTISFGSLVGNSLTLTASDSSTVVVDVSSLAVDTNLYVVSGTLNGTDIDLTMSDASIISIDAVSLGIDNNTTVTGGSVSGTNINLSLSDASIITIDASTLQGSTGSSNEVVSGSVVGTDLVLVMADASTITIDATNMINGSTNISTNSGWNISYGTNANQAVGTSTNDSTVNQQLPFYFGEALTRGSEFKFNFNNNGGSNLILGIWDGAEVATAYNGGTITQSNWGTAFTYAGGFTAGTNVGLTTTTNGTKYVVGTGDALSLRFHLDGHLELMDISSGTEIEIAKTTIPLAVTSFNIQMHTWTNGILPNGIISSSDFIWDIVHDYANTEAGVLNGALTHTVLKRNLALSVGEQFMIPLQKQGAGETFGIGYSAASTGNVTAEDNLLTSFKYQTNESIIADINWNHNTSSSRYFSAGGGAGIPSWRQGGAGTMQGLFSLRYLTDNTLQIWSETYNELVASSAVHPNGSDIYLYFGVNGNTSYVNLPSITKQLIGQGSQPLPSFQPTAANQTITVTEANALNFQIVTSDNVVNQFAESDAPSWVSLNQSSGVLSGTAPAYAGTSADTIVINCKAGNAIGGTVDFTVTVTIAQAAVSYSNTESLKLTSTSAYLQGNASNVTALQRASNGSGASDAWTINMWVKLANDSNTQQLFYYGGDSGSKGAISITQQNTTNIVFVYGKSVNLIAEFSINQITAGAWTMLTFTYSGASTGVYAPSMASYFDAFDTYINGVSISTSPAQAGNGFSNDLPSDLYRIGRGLTGDYAGLTTINQLAIYDSEKTSGEVTSIYDSGATQDLTSTSPAHLYEFGSSITTVSDSIGNADLTGYNFASSDIVTDAP